MDSAGIRNRIVRTAEVDPRELLPHLENWREHPTFQREAMAGILAEIGWVDAVKVSHRTGRILDGHLRVDLAVTMGEATVPVVYVDVDEDEERKVLATFDPVGELAKKNAELASELAAQVGSDYEGVQRIIEKLGGGSPTERKGLKRIDVRPRPETAWVLIGVPIAQAGAIGELVEKARKIEGATVESTLAGALL